MSTTCISIYKCLIIFTQCMLGNKFVYVHGCRYIDHCLYVCNTCTVYIIYTFTCMHPLYIDHCLYVCIYTVYIIYTFKCMHPKYKKTFPFMKRWKGYDTCCYPAGYGCLKVLWGAALLLGLWQHWEEESPLVFGDWGLLLRRRTRQTLVDGRKAEFPLSHTNAVLDHFHTTVSCHTCYCQLLIILF